MSGEKDIESLSVVTYEKAKFRAPSNRQYRFESGLQPNFKRLINSSLESHFLLYVVRQKLMWSRESVQEPIGTISEAKQTAQRVGKS